MITYSTNWMGPINLNWYRERGLTKTVREVLEEGRIIYPKGLGPGDVWEYEVVTTYYAGGRIDIRGVPGDEYWNGWHEYGVAPMHGEDWNALSDYLWDVTTEELLSYNALIEQFETHYGKKIRWADEITKNEEVPCKEHPDAPHGFNRNASHLLGRYVCDCEGWDQDD